MKRIWAWMKKHSTRIKTALLIAGLLALLIIMLVGMLGSRGASAEARLLAGDGLALIRAAVADAAGEGEAALFFSVSDGESRAEVYGVQDARFEDAWALGERWVSDRKQPLWVRVDLVTDVAALTPAEYAAMLADTRAGFSRQGVALDDAFAVALLEGELNANELIDYEGGGLDLGAVNRYLESGGRQGVDALPDTLYLFDTQGWFSGGDGAAHRLLDDPLNHGRRALDEVDGAVALEVLGSAADHLSRQVLEDGHFVYGYYAHTGEEINSYNILRHCGTVWSLICQYRVTGDESLVEKIDLTVECLANEYVEYVDSDTAFIVERKSGEIKIGGNALAVVALTNYQEEFGTDRYQPLAEALGRGILAMMDEERGTYWHVWSFPGFEEVEAFRTIYYDGEATFALARLYSITGEDRWLDAAKSALDHFVEEDYARYRDHWVSYAINEVTKHAPEPEYLTLGLRNAGENLQAIHDRDTTYHTYMELLMCTFELYDRMQQEGLAVDYLDEFEESYFLETIFYRADYMLNAYGYPEQVMYFADPQLALGAFFTRQDRFRMRIDDVQHFVGGYYSYYVNYDKLLSYADELL